MDPLRQLLEDALVERSFCEPLARYGRLLLEANRRMNLTGAESPDELLPHLLDSLSIAPLVRDSLVDVGSGGGLPAIPLAIATGVPVTMIESTGKKAAFLRAVLDELGLVGRVVAHRAETAGREDDLRERFASGTARAVSSASAVAELLLPFIAIGGTAILQRGRLEPRERNALSDAAPMLGGMVEQEIAQDGDRRVVVVRKREATPSRFPRRIGVPEKRPLCW
ncbi:MAG TPA: 16S rRNA (guanine(527)-N(7))-methyltransferase RsmG [Candidatus Baltobacteraceae bacterium]